MKKKILMIVSAAVAVIIAVLCIFRFVIIGGADMAQGEYKITNNSDYSQSSIVVKDKTIQFNNIDLNAIFQSSQIKLYDFMVDKGKVAALSEEELKKLSDLNEQFVSNPRAIDVESVKKGTFTYRYAFAHDVYGFGLLLEYDAFHKTITVHMGAGVTLIFQK